MAGNLFEVDKQCNAIVERSDIWVGGFVHFVDFSEARKGGAVQQQCSSEDGLTLLRAAFLFQPTNQPTNLK